MKIWSRRQRESVNTIRQSNRSGNHINCLRLFKNNTYDHERAKFELSWELLKQGHDIMTEAIFNNGKRADLLDLCCGKCYEILCTETLEQFHKKSSSYPEEFEVIPLKAGDIIKGEFGLV